MASPAEFSNPVRLRINFMIPAPMPTIIPPLTKSISESNPSPCMVLAIPSLIWPNVSMIIPPNLDNTGAADFSPVTNKPSPAFAVSPIFSKGFALVFNLSDKLIRLDASGTPK